MWVARVRLNGEQAILGSKCKECKVSLIGYPVSTFHTLNGVYVFVASFIFGPEKNVQHFFKEIKKDERIMQAERQDNFIICQIKEPPRHAKAYVSDMIHLEPIVIKADGTQLWTIGSWDKRRITDFLDIVETAHQGEILSIKKEKITNFSFLSMQPPLTNNQSKALEIAIQQGYYEYPRSIDVQRLAKEAGVSFSTYHAHLRKAENKLLPFLFNKIRKEE